MKQNLFTLREVLSQIQVWAQTALFVSFILMTFGVVLTQKKRLKTLFTSYLIVGISMAAAAAGYLVSISYAISQSLPNNLAVITDPAISESQKFELSESIRMAATYIFQDLATGVLAIGLLLITITTVGLVATHFISKRKEKKSSKNKKTS